jgi:hypothetical protein
MFYLRIFGLESRYEVKKVASVPEGTPLQFRLRRCNLLSLFTRVDHPRFLDSHSRSLLIASPNPSSTVLRSIVSRPQLPRPLSYAIPGTCIQPIHTLPQEDQGTSRGIQLSSLPYRSTILSGCTALEPCLVAAAPCLCRRARAPSGFVPAFRCNARTPELLARCYYVPLQSKYTTNV